MIINKYHISFIKKITSPEWKFGHKFFYFMISTCLLVIAYFHLNIGPLMSTDSIGYSESADVLIKLNFNFLDYYSQKTISRINPSYIYTIPVILISLTKYLFGDNWQFAFMIVNLILIFFSLIIFSKILLFLKVRPFIIALSLPILVLSVDLLTWPRYVLTDTIFSFLVMLIIYTITKSIIRNKFSYFALIFITSLIYLTRPTSLPFIFAIIFFITISKTRFNYNPKLILLFIFTLFILAPFIFAMLYQLMNNYLINSPQAYFLIGMVKSGMIIYDRPNTWVDAPNTFFDIVYIYFLRILFFFNPYEKSFSDIHVILNLIQAIYIFLSIFVWSLLGLNYRVFNKIVFFILLISFFSAAFHAFTLIDYDWRYRFPIIMPLLIIFPLSFEIFLRKIQLVIFKS
jgi:hypothetical protein